jgi:hypothetical protein
LFLSQREPTRRHASTSFVHFNNVPSAPKGCNALRELKQPSRLLNSPDSLAGIRSWVDKHRNHHPQCPTMKPQPSPSRALDLGINQEVCLPSKMLLVSLYRPAQKSSAPLYERGTQILYCTGPLLVGVLPSKITSVNLESHLCEIPWASLPKTFQEAALVTKKSPVYSISMDRCALHNPR